MYRVLTVTGIVVLLIGTLSTVAAFTVEDLGPRVEVLETRVSELRGLHDLDEPTVTPEPTATSEPEACSVPEGASVWHPPTTHEHGDQPPAWADDWSCEQFGHPVIFGGDEATPNENQHKHEAYKGFRFNEHGWDIYWRVHLASNPMDRAVRFHSYEVYALDLSGNVSFWQGWMDFGAVPDRRLSFNNMTLNDAVNSGAPFVIGSESPKRHKQEYWQTSQPDALWSWHVRVGIHDATTWFDPDEHLGDIHSVGGWATTGEKGLHRSSFARWGTAGRDADTSRGWFCATVYGEILQTNVGGPGGCSEGLPQYIAPTMAPTTGLPTTLGVPIVVRTYACPSCVLPN